MVSRVKVFFKFENHGALIMLLIWVLFYSPSSPNILSDENANNTE